MKYEVPLAPDVHISNKGCRRAYQRGPRSGNCECPEGCCWYEAQVERQDLGLGIERYDSWKERLEAVCRDLRSDVKGKI